MVLWRLLEGLAPEPDAVALVGRALLVVLGVAGTLPVPPEPPFKKRAKASTGSSPFSTAFLSTSLPFLMPRNWKPNPSGVLAPKNF